ncbi:hypothetical protein BDP27DRAFT_1375565 [Rhodocollybia butyracea]|uniref:Uncharacterized protein n=1 Tax=Rhodocollybia butyracea TaxID=206335 RepID=A0A9P5P5N1_9AGAR|nr:hypothetical protein BDP27DRAFT_1375565 [Rhodocollybia butyracea]
MVFDGYTGVSSRILMPKHDDGYRDFQQAHLFGFGKDLEYTVRARTVSVLDGGANDIGLPLVRPRIVGRIIDCSLIFQAFELGRSLVLSCVQDVECHGVSDDEPCLHWKAMKISIENLPGGWGNWQVSAVSLDERGAIIRTSEANLGNLLADAARAYYNIDIAFVDSGALFDAIG